MRSRLLFFLLVCQMCLSTGCEFRGTDSGNPRRSSAITSSPALGPLVEEGFCRTISRCGVSWRSEACSSQVYASQAFGEIYPALGVRTASDIENRVDQGQLQIVEELRSTCFGELQSWPCSQLPAEDSSQDISVEIDRFLKSTWGRSEACRTFLK